MSNRQEKKARKAAQRAGDDAYVHVKPQELKLSPLRVVQNTEGLTQHERVAHQSKRQIRERNVRYRADEWDTRKSKHHDD